MALLNLKNKKIVISAGASGIGWATTKICLSKGAYIYLCDINEKNLNKMSSIKSESFACLSAIKKKPAKLINRLF